MSLTVAEQRGHGGNSHLARWLLLFLLGIFAVGCGGSHGDVYVAGNSGVAPQPTPSNTTANLAFRFVQEQAFTGTVPVGTTSLQFDFFNSQDQEVFFAQAAYAASVTVADVPLSAVRVVITAYGAGGVPIATLEAPVKPVAGTTTPVDLSSGTLTEVTLESIAVSPQPIALNLQSAPELELRMTGRFSNGDTVVLNAQNGATLTFSGYASNVINVTAAGMVSAVGVGETSLDVSATVNGKSATAQDVPVTVAGTAPAVGRLVFDPSSLSLLAGESKAVKVTYFAPEATAGFDVTHLTIGSSSDANVSYTPGNVKAADSITSPLSSTITVLYKDGDTSVTGSFVAQVVPPAPPAPPKGTLKVSPSSLTFSTGGILSIVSGDFSSFGFIEAEFVPNGQTIGYDVTALVGVSFKEFFPSSINADSFTYLYLGGRGAVMTSIFGATPPVGTRATMTVTYIEDGVIYTKDIPITVGIPELERVEFLGATNNEILLPASTDTEYKVKAVAHYSNGYYELLDFDGKGGHETEFGDFLVLNANPEAGFDGANFDSDSDTPRDIALTVTREGETEVLGSATMRLQNVTPIRVDIVPSPIIVYGVGIYRVYLTYNDGRKLDVTDHWIVEEVDDAGYLAFCGCDPLLPGQMLGIQVGETEITLGDAEDAICIALPGLDSATIGPDVKVFVRMVNNASLPI